MRLKISDLNKGDVVKTSSGIVVTVEKIEGEVATCVWFLGSKLFRAKFDKLYSL